MKPSPEMLTQLYRASTIGVGTAIVAVLFVLLGYLRLREQFYLAYMTAFIFWISLSLGCLGIAMIHGMTGGRWGRTIRRVLEAGYETIPLMALLFLPIGLSVFEIYPWLDSEFVRHHESVARKTGYLNDIGFQWRALGYFVIWVVTTWLLNGSSPDEQDENSLRGRRLQQISGLGFLIFGFTVTLAVVDWVMSLEPTWYSTMYGLIHMAGQGMCGLSLAVIVVVVLRSYAPFSRTLTADRLNDLGSLMLASVMFWAYCSFFQFLVIWSGNLPEENSWYIHRSRQGWQYLAMLLMLLQFAVPFLLLLSRRIKRDPVRLCRVAILLIAMHYVDVYWIVAPAFQHEDASFQGFVFHWLNLATFASMGGLWLAMFAWRLSIRIRLPILDPELTEKAHERKLHAAAT